MKKTATQNHIYIVDITVAPGISLQNSNELAGKNHWAVFTPWPISFSHSGSKPKTLAIGGSWYPIKKDHYCSSTCRGYMDKKLGARTTQQQVDSIKQLQDVNKNGTQLTGTIDSIFCPRNNGRKTALKATIQTLGEIIMIDGAGHPQLTNLISNPHCTVYGSQANPWAPIADAKKLLKVYKMR